MRRARGFTLVEVLVAIGILAVVALLAWRATAAMTDSEVRLVAEQSRWRQLDALLLRVEADLRAAVPRPARDGASTAPPWLLAPEDSAGNSLLVFTRAGGDAVDEPGSGGRRIGYRVRGDRVETLYWPRIDNPAATVPAVYVLANAVRRLAITALTADNRWSDRWPLSGDASTPRGVRLVLELADGTSVERWFVLQ